MPLKIVRNSIIQMNVQAIVNPTDRFCSGGGSIDAKIHNLCGIKLKEQLITKIPLNTSEAIITDAFNMNCEKIIHVVGPRWEDDYEIKLKQLMLTYKNALELAKENNIQSIAIPLISTGTFKFPKELGLKIATDMITSFLLKEEMEVYLVVFDKTSFSISKKLFSDIEEFIDDNYIVQDNSYYRMSLRKFNETYEECRSCNMSENEDDLSSASYSLSFDDIFTEDTFSVKLFSIIDSKGLKDPEVYKKANIDRKLFSKIRSNENYNPSKKTAIALAIALELNLKDTQDLLSRAGYVLSKSNKFDLVIEYCITHKNYNIFDINNILFSFDLPLLD